MTKQKSVKTETVECMVCHNPGKHQLGMPGDRAPLCGVHVNQLRKMLGHPLDGLGGLTRREIRAAFGFVILD